MVCNGGVTAEEAWSSWVVFGTFPRFVFPALVVDPCWQIQATVVEIVP
jgi:hypothetical protein